MQHLKAPICIGSDLYIVFSVNWGSDHFWSRTGAVSLFLGVSEWRRAALNCMKKISVSKPVSHRGQRRYAKAPGEMKRGDCESLKWDHLGWAFFFFQAEWDNNSNTQVQNAVWSNMAIALSHLTVLKYRMGHFKNAPFVVLCSAQSCCFVHTKTLITRPM